MDIKLTANGHDIDLTSMSSPVMVRGSEAILQHVKIRLLILLGEFFLDPDAGIPYLQVILQKGTSPSLIREIFRKCIIGTPGIESVTRLDLNTEATTRVSAIAFEAVTDESEVLRVGFGDLVVQIGG